MKIDTPSVAQQQLKKNRDEVRALLLAERELTDNNDSFPRSATLRWLLNGGGQRFAGSAAGGLLIKFGAAIPLIMRVVPMILMVQRLFRKSRQA